jgi:hypothetical protein
MAWSHRIVKLEQKTAQILIEEGFRDRVPIRELPRIAWFAVYCQSAPPTNSFWDPEESTPLDALETKLLQLCDQLGNGWAVYVLRIATCGIREYFVYFGGSANFDSVVPQLKRDFPNYRIKYETADDAAWNRYLSCLPQTSG